MIIDSVYRWPEEATQFMSDFKNYEFIATNGCFDLGIHIGHSITLASMNKYAQGYIGTIPEDINVANIVLLNSDRSIRKLNKGEYRPYFNETERAKSLLSCYWFGIDAVIIFNEESPYEIYKILKPVTIVKGFDYKDKKVEGAEFAQQGVTIAEYPDIDGIFSTTEIESRIVGFDTSRKP